MRRRAQLLAAGLVLGAVFSVQSGGALATTLFDEVGPLGAVFLRSLFGAAVLAAIWRPTLAAPRPKLRLAGLFGLSLAGMNLCFYLALDRLPLGIAVTFEFSGPLAVALLGSRRALDLLWAGLAALGILLLSGGFGGSDLDPLGVAFALAAGAFWAAYILLGARVGRAFGGGIGLAIAMIVSTAVLFAPGLAGGGAELLSLGVLATGAGVAMLSSVVPYSLELEALRRLPAHVFGVLMSLEPAVAAVIGFIALDQGLVASEVLAIGCVVLAGAGALRSAPTPPRIEA